MRRCAGSEESARRLGMSGLEFLIAYQDQRLNGHRNP
jgi:hypothetical protein